MASSPTSRMPHEPLGAGVTAPGLAGWTSATSGPLYRRLAEAIRAAIGRGELTSGSRLPTERALAVELAVSRSTVVAAYDLLRGEGWLESRQGSGTWVRRQASVVRFGEDRPGFLGRSTVSFRALIEGPGDAVEFTCAALPAGDLFDRPAVARAFEDLSRVARSSIGYEAAGHAPLRRAIAEHLSRRWGLATSGDEVIVTTGAQQAIGLAAALYTRPGDVVAVEDPTYLTAIDVFTAAGVRLLPVPIGVQGLRPERLRDALVDSSARFAYVMPTFHNPTGAVMPERERRELAHVADELQIPIVEDLTVADLALDQEPPPPIGAFQAETPVLTIGSLSKVLWGGLRVGWIRAPAPVIQRLSRMKLVMDHGSSVVSQILALRLIEDLDAIREERRELVRSRRHELESLLREQLPEWSWERPAGGLCLWVRIPAGDALSFSQVASQHGVALVAGPMTSVDGRFADRIRLPYVLEPEEMREGVRRLAGAWADYEPELTARPRAVRVVV
ncbi:MAG TPA: PLP-dependent aminotransferase family protein [Actinomycetota bacterium]|nr:PLP-dependent aminotransferase family protein [Actinomycetota bacterium]